MRKDLTIIQIGIFLILIAGVWIAIFQRQQTPQQTQWWTTLVVQQVAEGTTPTIDTTLEVEAAVDTVVVPELLTDLGETPNKTLVANYFNAIESWDYTQACWYLSDGKCAERQPGAVEQFSQEFAKLIDGYSYLNIKDLWIVAPSGKEIVCVKYTYRYEDDTFDSPISEIYSYYIAQEDWIDVITDRVCEKKYKDWRGVRPCPIQANAEFCEGNIR